MFVGKVSYNSVPTMSADVDIPSKKYVDDQDTALETAYIAADAVVTAAYQAADAAAKDYLFLAEQSADPADPDEGYTVIWMSDGTGTGADGDVIIKGKAGDTVKYTTLFDHSAGT